MSRSGATSTAWRAVAALALLAGLLGTAGAPATRAAVRAQGSLPRVSFTAPSGGSLIVHGTYPRVESSCVRTFQPVLHSRHLGTIEVGKDDDGSLFVVGVLPFEDYVKGIAEVPRTWPMEALKAQAVAARTYALARMRYGDATGARLGYEICATTACQVYRGLGVAEGPYGERWRAAVDQTAGEALLHDGRPADTLYFSTSNGRTLGNDEVFGTDPVPYLRPVQETDDGASPLSRWSSALPLADAARFLRAAGHWPDRPLMGARRSGPDVVLSGGGVTRTLPATDFRDHLNYWAPCLAPDRFPPAGPNGVRLPQTVPSRWFEVAVRNGSVVIEGRGWGHGVGMVQWGAYGKADRGLGYGDILAAYYGGLRPVEHDTPDTIRVGIATGLTSVRLAGTASGVAIRGGRPGPGPWLVTGGKVLRVRGRAGPVPSYHEPGTLGRAPNRVRAGARITATVTVPDLSVVRLVLRIDGRDVPVSPLVTVEAGTSTIQATVPDLPTGTYTLQAIFSDGVDQLRTGGRPFRVRGAAPPGPAPSPTPSPSPTATAPVEPPSPPPETPVAVPAEDTGRVGIPVGLALLVVGGAVAAVGVVLMWRRRKPGPAAPEPRGG